MRTLLARITAFSASLTALVVSLLFVASALPALATAGNCPQIDSVTGTACPAGQFFWGGGCHATDLVCPNSGTPGDPRVNPSCSAGSCNCPSGSYCGTSGKPKYNQCVTPSVTCSGGQTWDVCTDTCIGDVIAVLHDYTAAPQASQGSATADLRILGNVKAANICTSGGVCLTTSGGSGWNSTVTNDMQFLGHQIGIGTNPTNAALGPEYPLDIFADGNINGVGNAAVVRIVDSVGNLWTGTSLARYNSGMNTINEKWFVGMDGSASNNLLFRSNGVNVMSITPSGTIQIPTGAVAGYVLTSDASGNATWQASTAGYCSGSTVAGVTAATSNGAFSGPAAQLGYDSASAKCNIEFAGSHICSPDEMIRSISCNKTSNFGLVGQTVWIANGAPGFTSPAVNDCSGFTSGVPSSFGALWKFASLANGGGAGFATTCDSTMKIVCCK